MKAQLLEKYHYIGHVPGPCAYLPERFSNLLFLEGTGVGLKYRTLIDYGYRRHGMLLYRPDCGLCKDCQIVRVPAAEFQMSSSQRRIKKKGDRIFSVSIQPVSYTPEKSGLYHRYLKFQHTEKPSFDPVEEELSYREFFVDSCLGSSTMEIQLHAEGKLAGVGILDRLDGALSSVYFYFNPDYAKYSPGTYSILAEIELCRAWNLNYYYPGYFIAGCRTMNYKTNFRPCELMNLRERAWRLLT